MINNDDTVSFIAQSTGERLVFKKGKDLGRGVFGEVCELQTLGGEKTEFVLKKIRCVIPKEEIIEAAPFVQRSFLRTLPEEHFHEYRYAEVFNELHSLHSLQLLEGYQREGATFYLILKKIEGAPLARLPYSSINLDALIKAVYYLHRRGYVHLDLHSDNCLQNGNNLTLLDFGHAKEASYLDAHIDYVMVFLMMRSKMPIQTPDQDPRLLRQIARVYFVAVIEYAYQHKLQTLFNLSITLMCFAGLVGVPLFTLSPYLLQQFMFSVVFDGLARESMAECTNAILSKLGEYVLSRKRAEQVAHLVQFFCFASLGGFALTCSWGPGPAVWGARYMQMGWKALLQPELFAILNSLQTYSLIKTMSRRAMFCADSLLLPNVLKAKRSDLLFREVYPRLNRAWNATTNKVGCVYKKLPAFPRRSFRTV